MSVQNLKWTPICVGICTPVLIDYPACAIRGIVIYNEHLQVLYLQGQEFGRHHPQIISFIVGWEYD